MLAEASWRHHKVTGVLGQEPGNPQSSDQQTRNLEAADPEDSLGPGLEHKSKYI